MNVFILEDDPTNERLPFFRKKLNKHTLFIAKEAEEGVRVLQEMLDKHIPIDYIFLDHDLGGRIYVDSGDENCGMRVAEFIKLKGIRAEIILHTQNIVGADNMRHVLPEARIIPFPTLMKTLEG